MSKVKNLGFPIDEKLHRKMKMYLLSLKNDITIKDYITELIEKDLKNKKVYKIEKEEEYE